MSAPKAAAKALAAHLVARTGLPSAAVLPYWPPPTMALPRPVAVAVHVAGEAAHDAELGGPELVSMTPIPGGATATARYRLGSWTIPLAVEVWARNAAERDTYARAVYDALTQPPTVGGAPAVDVMSGATLTLADYFAAPCTFDTEGWNDTDTPDAAAREEWRSTFQVTARVDDLAERVVTYQTATTVTVAASPHIAP